MIQQGTTLRVIVNFTSKRLDMKKRHFLAIAAYTVFATSNAQINSVTGDGFLLRACEMMEDGNYIGCLDQLRCALQLPLSASDQERAAFMKGCASVYTNKNDARMLLKEFLSKYPASEFRFEAFMALGDCSEGEEALMIYREIYAPALPYDKQSELNYRMGCALLKTGEFEEAERCLALASDNPRYAKAIQFYKGYIDYIKGNLAQAQKQLELSRGTSAPNNMANVYLSQIYFSNDEWQKALSAAKEMLKAIGKSPKDFNNESRVEMNRVAGESSFMLGDSEQARSYLQSYIKDSKSPAPSAKYILGLLAYEEGDYEKCVDFMQPATKVEDAMSQTAYLYIGQSLLALGDYDSAIIAFDKALNLDFDKDAQETAYYNYAVASLKGGKVPFGNTVNTFEDFLNLYPNSRFAPEAQNYIIASYFNDNDYHGAIESINAMKNPTPETIKAKQMALYLYGSQLLAKKDYMQAADNLTLAAGMRNVDKDVALEATLALADMYYQKGNYAEAETNFEKYLSEASANAANRPVAVFDMGYAMFIQKKFSKAEKYFKQLIDSKASLPPAILADAYCRLGDCLYNSNRFSEAADAYENAYSINPSVGDYALFQKALMKGYQRQHSQKITLLEEMQSLFPTSALIPDALLEMTESFIQLNDKAKAIEIYKQLVNQYPNTEQGRQGYLQMAITMLNVGQRQNAIDSYKNVISHYPTSVEAQLASEQLKRIAAEDGKLAEYVNFMASVPNAPKVDADEVEKLTFEAAEKEYITENKTRKLSDYINVYATEASTPNPTHAAKALSYLLEEALAEGKTEAAYSHASAIASRFPDSNVVMYALSSKADIEYKQGKGMLALRTWKELANKASAPYWQNMAQMGIMRCAAAASEFDQALAAANSALASPELSEADRYEALFTRGLAHSANGNEAAARSDWEKASDRPADLNSMRSSFELAQSYFNSHDYEKAETLAKKLATTSTPHIYWMARAFILLADTYSATGNDYKAQQYLKSLRKNYPGTEDDIFQMIDMRMAAE